MASGSGETEEEALQRISVSPQCGFASHEEGNLLGMEDMEKKLVLKIWQPVSGLTHEKYVFC